MRISTAIKRTLGAAFMLPVAVASMAVSPVPEVSPATGNFPGPISKVTLTFPGASDIAFSSRALLYYDPSESVDKAGIIYFGGDELDQRRDSYRTVIDGNTVSFIPTATDGSDEEWTIQGKYGLMIPAGAISMTIDGKTENCPELGFTWYISNMRDPYFSPGAGEISSMNGLTLTCPEGFEFSGGFIKMSLYRPTLYNCVNGQKSGAAIANFPLPTTAAVSGVNILEFESPMRTYPVEPFIPESGKEYILELPQSSIKIKNVSTGEVANAPSQQIIWRYVDGQTSVGELVVEPAASYTVHTLQGVCLMKDASVDAIEALSPGIYIINGKKVALR